MKKRFVYSPNYYLPLGDHVFPAHKYKRLYEKLIVSQVINEDEVIEPLVYPGIKNDLALVHTPEYLDDLFNQRLTERTAYSELPLNKIIVDRFVLATAGTITASDLALKNDFAINLSGGFHHAFADHAEGFCYLNDIAIAASRLLTENKVTQILIVDLDLHQGNGTAHIFQNEPRVFTFSMHQQNNYPPKQKGDMDIGLPDLIEDKEYLTRLNSSLDDLFGNVNPDFVFYLAGADPYYKDVLGSLKLTIDGLISRDKAVINKCLSHKVPFCIVLAGGYAENTEDTIEIHYNTCVLLKEID